MTIPLEQTHAVLESLQIPQIANLFAQAHAKHVLHEVGEAPENFPSFDPDLDERVTFSAYALLAVGCSLIEQKQHADGYTALEKGASLLRNVNEPYSSKSRESSFHVLLAAMAFYAAGHYSQAFVTIHEVEEKTQVAKIIASFLRKEFTNLIKQLNEVLLRDPPELDTQLDLDEWAITIAISRAVAETLEFIFAGNSEHLDLADNQLKDASIVATAGDHTAWWWIIRLLRLMLKDLQSSSLWKVLPPHFGAGNANTLGKYVQLLTFGKCPVIELWSSQRAALPLALSTTNRGAVVNLRTSAGKTRVAELAILQTLLANPEARIFYLAPFRSLALEVEQTLASTFNWLGHRVSHLYGGSRVSSIDRELAIESAITIATPEKTRALFRAAPELFENIKLIIIDEGHLLGGSERYVRNEIFIDHLRYLARKTGARILLLSAVLPNPQELAEWITGDPDAVVASMWKPSVERFGLLRWNNVRARIDWLGEVNSFNPSFIEKRPLGFGRRRTPFPKNKIEAIAATAVRLSSIGSVMIFSGKASSIPNLAKATLLGLGESPPNHSWPDREWKVFEAVCQEELDSDAIELRAARAGIICHSNRLTPQVRLAMEHLMRARPPRIIIATTTLAQGVNIGISSVIIATPFIGAKTTIDKGDFWNICGRAGRAFVDGEGKILYTIDDTQKPWQIKRDKDLARHFFDNTTADRVESGILFILTRLRNIASQTDVPFNLLLEIAANNDFSSLGEKASVFEHACDLLDDELLALHIDSVTNPSEEEPEIWIEQVFRNSLAGIQARAGISEIETADVLAFLKARAVSTIRRINDPIARKAIASSGLPLNIAIHVLRDLEVFRGVIDSFIHSGGTLSALVHVVNEIEIWVRSNATSVTERLPKELELDSIREKWLRGIGLREIIKNEAKAITICRNFYGYQLPWIVHAISQQFRVIDDIERAENFAKIALLIELGLSNELAAKIFLAGVRSRAAASELSSLDVIYGSNISSINDNLRNSTFADYLRPHVSPTTSVWLDLMAAPKIDIQEPIPEFSPFTLPDSTSLSILYARKLNDIVFLCSPDGQTRFKIKSTEQLPFDKVANNPRLAFRRFDSAWYLDIRDPRIVSNNAFKWPI